MNGLSVVDREHLHWLLLVQSVLVHTNYRVCAWQEVISNNWNTTDQILESLERHFRLYSTV